MEKNKSGNILLLDNDVMVNLFDLHYAVDKDAIQVTVSHLTQLYPRIWVPQTVKNEFLRSTGDKKREKRLKKVLRDFPSITDCPIPVGRTEITTLIGFTNEDAGEADAIIQAQKAKSTQHHFFKDIVFLTNDKGAQRLAKQLSVSVLRYQELVMRMREVGVLLIS